MFGKVVNFVAIDTTGLSDRPYLTLPVEKSVVPKPGLVYGIDIAAQYRKVFFVEGVTDKWRMGFDTMALLGKRYYPQQLTRIRAAFPDRKTTMVVCLDADATTEGKKFASQLADIYDDVKHVTIEGGDNAKDPDQFSDEQIAEIKAV